MTIILVRQSRKEKKEAIGHSMVYFGSSIQVKEIRERERKRVEGGWFW